MNSLTQTRLSMDITTTNTVVQKSVDKRAHEEGTTLYCLLECMSVNKELTWSLWALCTLLDGCRSFAKIDYNSQDENANSHQKPLHGLVCHHHPLTS